jgi:protein tyrosine/serine phosphatase
MLSEWKRRVGSRLYRWRDVPPVILAVLAVSAAVLGVCLGVRFSENVHVVAPGLVYRSAQLWPEELEFVIADYGIRSIISLVPPEPERPWYRGEISVSTAHQIVRYEIPLSRGVRPTPSQLRDLISVLREAPKPLLIHSKSGADRVGLAAAIFQYAIAARTADEAGRQLSIRYGHLPFILQETEAMDASFAEFVSTIHSSRL